MSVTYKTVYWGDPLYKVGDDGSFWTFKRSGGKWRRRFPSPLSKKDPRPALCFILNGRRQNIQMCHLVLRTFVGPAAPGMEACHFPDRDVTNNALSNLRWDSRVNNFKDRDNHGTTARGSSNGQAKLNEQKVLAIREQYASGTKPKRLAEANGVDQSLIHLIVKRKIWRHI